MLTCLSAGNQENVLDLAIKEEHKQNVAYGLARYASTALLDAENGGSKMNRMQQSGPADEEDMEEVTVPDTSFVETHAHEIPTMNNMPLREPRAMRR